MQHEIIEKIAKRVKEIDPRISATPDGGTIVGCFRGKGGENYKYTFSSRSFVYNNNGATVRKAFETAVAEITGQ